MVLNLWVNWCRFFHCLCFWQCSVNMHMFLHRGALFSSVKKLKIPDCWICAIILMSSFHVLQPCRETIGEKNMWFISSFLYLITLTIFTAQHRTWEPHTVENKNNKLNNPRSRGSHSLLKIAAALSKLNYHYRRHFVLGFISGLSLKLTALYIILT